jgi:hypothetical protein
MAEANGGDPTLGVKEAARAFELSLARSLDLCHSAASSIVQDVLNVDTAVSSSASYKQKSTIGVMLSGTAVDNIVIGGPAYGKLDKGDLIKKVDGQSAKSENIASLLFGSDVPGSEVKIEFLTCKGKLKNIVLRRMKVESIADRHQMFHLFTEVKKSASRHNDNIMGTLVDKSIDHWTKMLIADAEHDQKVCENVETMQQEMQRTLQTLTEELESMRAFTDAIFLQTGVSGDRKPSHWDETLKLVRKQVKSDMKAATEQKEKDKEKARSKISAAAQAEEEKHGQVI